MKFLRLILTGLYCVFAAIGVLSIITGKASPFASVFVIIYAITAAALNLKGGKPARWVAYGLSVLFMVLGVVSFGMLVSSFFGQEFDQMLSSVLAMFGVIGFCTFVSLKKQGQDV